MKIARIKHGRGFSLIEIAVVLLIIAVLVSIVAIPISSRDEQSRISEMNRQLDTIKEALIVYAFANGRLPCPATDGNIYGAANSSGAESPTGGGACTVKLGSVPASALGVSPVDSSGFAIDAWVKTNNSILNDLAGIGSGGCLTVFHPFASPKFPLISV
jgi:prepilin-type N-terminal cleavage/methylation domain-containing protein